MSDDTQSGPAWAGWPTPPSTDKRMRPVQERSSMDRNALENAMILAGDRGGPGDRAVRVAELDVFAGQLQQQFAVPVRELTGLIADPALLFRNAGLSAPEIVESLPVTDNFAGRLVFLTTDSKLYRYTIDETWTAEIPAVDVTGQISETQIADNAITTPKLVAGAVTANEIAGNTITGDKIVANTITGGLLATAGIITQAAQIGNAVVSTAAIQNGAITNALIQNAAVTNAKIGNLQVDNAKIANGAVTNAKISGIIQSDNYSSSQGWRIDKNGNAIFNTLTLRNGIIGTNPLADFAVNTGKIAQNAISNTVNYITAATTSLPANVWTQIGGLTVSSGTFLPGEVGLAYIVFTVHFSYTGSPVLGVGNGSGQFRQTAVPWTGDGHASITAASTMGVVNSTNIIFEAIKGSAGTASVVQVFARILYLRR